LNIYTCICTSSDDNLFGDMSQVSVFRPSQGLLDHAKACLVAGVVPDNDVVTAAGLGLEKGGYASVRQRFQRMLNSFELEGDNIVYKNTGKAIPPLDKWKDLVMDIHQTSHVNPKSTWSEVSDTWKYLYVTMHLHLREFLLSSFIVTLSSSLLMPTIGLGVSFL